MSSPNYTNFCRQGGIPPETGIRPAVRCLQRSQVAVELPLRHLGAVLVPLGALELDIPREDVLPEGLLEQLRGGERLDRLAERSGQRLDALLDALLVREAVEVRRHLGRQLVAFLDPLEARMEQRREREVGVTGRVGAADLGPGGLLGARLVERDPDQGRAVAL